MAETAAPGPSPDDDAFYLNLSVGIIRQAAADLRGLPEGKLGNDRLSKRVARAIDAHEFLESDTFHLVCSALGVGEHVVRNEIHRRVARGDLDSTVTISHDRTNRPSNRRRIRSAGRPRRLLHSPPGAGATEAA